MAERRDVISITLRSIIISTFLIRSATSQTSSYPIVLTRLGGPRSRPNPHIIIIIIIIIINIIIITTEYIEMICTVVIPLTISRTVFHGIQGE